MSSKDTSSAGTASDAADAPGASAAPASSAAARGAAWRRVASDVSAGARTAAPVIKRGGTRVGDWLARIGWGKFFVLAILLLIFGNIVSSALFDRAPAVVVERGADRDVEVSVNVTSDGVKIAPGRVAPPAPPTPPTVPSSSSPPAPPTPPVPPSPDSTAVAGKPTATPAGVVVDDSGVRIVADDNGRKVTVQIDGRGIRVTEGARAAAGASGAAGEVVIDAAAASDPEKMAEAIETARSKIEEIVSDQVRQQVAQRTRVYQESSSDWFNTFIVLLIVTGIIVKIVLGSKRKAEVRAQAATATAAEEGLKRQLAEAQLKMMQAQVEPHFLFNTLANVQALVAAGSPQAPRVLDSLIAYLRAAVPRLDQRATTLRHEEQLVRAYLDLMHMRMPDRLRFAVEIDEATRDLECPPMTLLTLVENAVRHGIDPAEEGGRIEVRTRLRDGRCHATVLDTGVGLQATSAGLGTGLSSLRERLQLAFGGDAELRLSEVPPHGVRAEVEFPARRATA